MVQPAQFAIMKSGNNQTNSSAIAAVDAGFPAFDDFFLFYILTAILLTYFCDNCFMKTFTVTDKKNGKYYSEKI